MSYPMADLSTMRLSHPESAQLLHDQSALRTHGHQYSHRQSAPKAIQARDYALGLQRGGQRFPDPDRNSAVALSSLLTYQRRSVSNRGINNPELALRR